MNDLSMIEHAVEVWRVNAFTTTPFTGNPAGVVPDADGLSERLMLAIAGELNDISETVFIGQPDAKSADVRFRFRHNSGGVSRKGRGGKGVDSPHFYGMVNHR